VFPSEFSDWFSQFCEEWHWTLMVIEWNLYVAFYSTAILILLGPEYERSFHLDCLLQLLFLVFYSSHWRGLLPP
jgi:hypothetical protein